MSFALKRERGREEGREEGREREGGREGGRVGKKPQCKYIFFAFEKLLVKTKNNRGRFTLHVRRKTFNLYQNYAAKNTDGFVPTFKQLSEPLNENCLKLFC